MPSPSPSVTPPSVVPAGFETFVGVLTIALLIAPVLSLIATVYIWRIYYKDTSRPRSWVVFRLAIGATITEVVSIAVAWLVVQRLRGVPFGFEGTVVLGLGILILELIPPLFAYSVWRLRHP